MPSSRLLRATASCAGSECWISTRPVPSRPSMAPACARPFDPEPMLARIVGASRAWLGRRPLRLHAPRARNRPRQGALPQTPSHDRAGVRTDEVQPPPRPLLTPRTIGRQVGMAAIRRQPQPAQAPQPPDSRRRGLTPDQAANPPPSDRAPAHGAHASSSLFPTATDEGSCLLHGAEGSAATRKVVGFTRRPPQTLSRAASWESVNSGKATTRASRLMPSCRYFDGASRTRTGDLLGAIRARAGLESRRFAGLLASTRRVRPGQNARGLPAITGSLPPKTPLRGQTSAPSREVPPPTGPD
jgi:hypothetical protein